MYRVSVADNRIGNVQGSAKRLRPGLVNFVAAVAYHLCLSLPAAFTQPSQSLLAKPCAYDTSWHRLRLRSGWKLYFPPNYPHIFQFCRHGNKASSVRRGQRPPPPYNEWGHSLSYVTATPLPLSLTKGQRGREIRLRKLLFSLGMRRQTEEGEQRETKSIAVNIEECDTYEASLIQFLSILIKWLSG